MRALLLALSFVAATATAAEPLATVGAVDLPRYAGQWYEIAKYPNRFQRQCIADTAATYRLLDDGNVAVVNRCRTAEGMDEATGVARRLEGRTDRLQVSFLPAALRWLPRKRCSLPQMSQLAGRLKAVLPVDVFGQPADFLVEQAVAELQDV